MNFPFFATFIIFIVWLTYELYKRRRIDETPLREFWAKEYKADRTGKKPLDDLEYIKIPFESLPMEVLNEDETIAEYKDTLRFLNESPIVNFTGISNTDLKLRYGAANIDLLSRYDQNYTVLARTLNSWAARLYDKGFAPQARGVLEFAVSTGTDVSGSYRLLCQIYNEEGTPEKIDKLYPVAESVNSAMRKTILRILDDAKTSIPETGAGTE